MQDSYAFDVGDFGKIGLLRHILGKKPSATLGVIWYATESSKRKGNDGKHTAYLQNPSANGEVANCDPSLYERFKAARKSPGRSISALQKVAASAIRKPAARPGSTVFYKALTARGYERTYWFCQAANKMKAAELVFCDPDNGIAKRGSPNERSKSDKHVLLDEINALHLRGQAVLVYHHLSRSGGGHAQQISRWLRTLRRVTGEKDVAAAHFNRGTSRVYFSIPGSRMKDLSTRIRRLKETIWVRNGHFEIFPATPR
jgi:hypothetical protein